MRNRTSDFKQVLSIFGFFALAGLTDGAIGAVTVPGAPTIGAATAGNASASIAFTAPSSNGGATITGYTASCVTGSTTKTGTGTSSPISVSSLTNGSAYSCTVKASNSAGNSAASSAVSVGSICSSLDGMPHCNVAAWKAQAFSESARHSSATCCGSTVAAYILRRYCPPTSNKASVI